MRSTHAIVFFGLLVVSFLLPLYAQETNESLGDLARRQRASKQEQSDNSRQTEASETSGLQEGNFKANILITDSQDAIEKWVLLPETKRADAGRIRQVTTGIKYYLPFVVTNYQWPASERMTLTAHVVLISPHGKTQYECPEFSRTIFADPRSPSVIVLNPVMNYTFDSSDLPGTYTIRVTVKDHVHSAYAKAEEQFQLIQGASAEVERTPATAPPTKPR